jgi:hypothetical protein
MESRPESRVDSRPAGGSPSRGVDAGGDDGVGRVRRALRLWAVADGVYATAVGLLAILVVPWKSPGFNVAVLLWAASLLAGAPFLWRGHRFAHRLAVVTSLLGLAGALLAVAGLVASWAYLRAAYGAFGAGASLASLLVAGMVFEVLGLYPALRLHGLLREEVRRAMRAGKTGPLIVVAALVLLPLPVGLAVTARYGLSPLPPLPAEAARAALSALRLELDGREQEAAAAARALPPLAVGPGPLFVSLWDEGKLVARVSGSGDSLASAVTGAGRSLQAVLATRNLSGRGRLKLDRVTARGPILRSLPLALALGFDPGLDGLLDADDRAVFLGDDVIRASVAGAAAPLPALSELRIGIDVAWIEARIAAAGARAPLTRVRTEGWIEAETGAAPVYRGNVAGTQLPGTARAGIEGADYLLRQVQSDGRFRYRYQPFADDGLDADAGEYSLARHAGAAYGLAVLYGVTGQVRFRDGALDALGWLARQIPPSCGAAADRLCLVEAGRAAFGPSALAAAAMFEYQRRTSDRRFEGVALGLAAFLSDRQRADGEFQHGFDPAAGVEVPGPPRLFASEQAALALVLAHRVTGQPAPLRAAERALDFLTRRKYDFPLGRFIYGADHWTCIAAEEAWPALTHPQYLDFCRGYASFMHRLQYQPTPDRAPRDFVGHYGFGYQLVPQAPATAGFTEALLSTIALCRHHGIEPGDLVADARSALGALLREQLRDDNSYLAHRPERARGGFRRSLVEPEIRIDFVQHAATALARAASMGFSQL